MLKILLKNRFLALVDQFTGQSKGKKAASIGAKAVMAILGILVIVGVFFLMNALLGNMCAAFIQGGVAWLFFAFVAIFEVIISLLLTLFYAQGAVFEAKDNELLLSMPIPPSAILASRMGTLYFLNLFISLATLGGAGYTFVNNGGTLGTASILILALCILLLPLFCTMLSCLVGWLVSFITRHMRNKTPIQLALYLIGFGAFYFGMQNINEKLKALQTDPEGLLQAFRTWLYPFQSLGRAVAEGNFLQMLIFAACCIIPFSIVYYILSASFISIVTARSSAKKATYEATELKGSSVVSALTKKDLTRFFNSSSYMFNAGLGLLYTIGMALLALINGDSITKGLVDQATGTGDVGAAMNVINAFLLSLVAGVTSISAVSLSAEAKNLWILKSMPVRAKEVLTAKFMSHFVLAGPASILASILYLISSLTRGVSPDALSIAVLFLLPLAANLFCALSGVVFNLFYGKMDYPNITKATKSAASIVPMLILLVVIGLPGAIWIMALKDAGLSIQLMGIITTVFVVILDALMYVFLGSAAAQKRWDVLGNQ